MKNRMWSACAGAVAMLMLLPGSPASAQQKTEISLSRQPGIFYMPSHIMEKQQADREARGFARRARRHHQMDQP